MGLLQSWFVHACVWPRYVTLFIFQYAGSSYPSTTATISVHATLTYSLFAHVRSGSAPSFMFFLHVHPTTKIPLSPATPLPSSTYARPDVPPPRVSPPYRSPCTARLLDASALHLLLMWLRLLPVFSSAPPRPVFHSYVSPRISSSIHHMCTRPSSTSFSLSEVSGSHVYDRCATTLLTLGLCCSRPCC